MRKTEKQRIVNIKKKIEEATSLREIFHIRREVKQICIKRQGTNKSRV